MISASKALQLLKEGNERFAQGLKTNHSINNQRHDPSLADGQKPFAIILGCSDSRVPAEIVFDQGLGDLFVIRVAGNIVAPSQIGSVEFAADLFETRLVVVMGHTNCGAIYATIDQARKPSTEQSHNLDAIVNRIKPSVLALFDTELANDEAKLRYYATRANIRASVNQLRHGSSVLENLIQNYGLTIVGAEYSIETGRVDFFEC
ncbi:MAG: hypothetical protein RLZZ502_577 [Pseudomonadota bacterium]|jgi:carbonic anhydrase